MQQSLTVSMMPVMRSVSVMVSVVSVTIAVTMSISLPLVVAVMTIAVVNDLEAVLEPEGLIGLCVTLYESHGR